MKKLTIIAASLLGALALVGPSTAAAKDRNHDNLPDGWEKANGLSLAVNQAKRDQDRDGLSNRGEFRAADRPHDRDTDNDGTLDGAENAGTITSFDATSGELVIKQFSGGSVTGTVTDATRIECEDRNNQTDPNEVENENEAEHPNGDARDHGSGSGSGDDNSGSGSSNSGSDNSGPGSSDSGGDNSGPGSANSGRGDDDPNRDCSASDLTPGASVQEAHLEVSGNGSVFEEIELVKDNG